MSRKVSVIPVDQIEEEPAQEEGTTLDTASAEAPAANDDADEINTEDLEFLIAETQERKGKKAQPKAECPDCGKTMSAKALKYSHVPNCKAKPLPPPPPEPAKPIKTRAPRKPKEVIKEEPPPIEPPIPKNQTRQEIRKQRFSSLASQAF